MPGVPGLNTKEKTEAPDPVGAVRASSMPAVQELPTKGKTEVPPVGAVKASSMPSVQELNTTEKTEVSYPVCRQSASK